MESDSTLQVDIDIDMRLYSTDRNRLDGSVRTILRLLPSKPLTDLPEGEVNNKGLGGGGGGNAVQNKDCRVVGFLMRDHPLLKTTFCETFPFIFQ